MCLWEKRKRYYEDMNSLEASLSVKTLMPYQGFLT